MSRIVAFVALGLLVGLPALGADEKDKKDDAKKADAAKKAEVKKDEAKKDEAKKDKKAPAKMPVPKKAGMKNLDRDPDAAKEKALHSGVITAKVMAVVEDKKTVRLQLTVPYLKVNTGALQNYVNAQARMSYASNPQQLLQYQQQMIQAEAQIYQVATTTQDVEWQATDDVKVRMMNPPAQFDDKGRIKKYTKKELKELKGDDKQPGYPGEFSDVKQDQIVQVTIVKKKDAPRTPVKRGKAKDADPDLLPENQPHISLIMILVEPKNNN
jgi:hypothetical protein